MKYTWDITELLDNLKKIERRLEEETSSEEKHKCLETILTYIEMSIIHANASEDQDTMKQRIFVRKMESKYQSMGRKYTTSFENYLLPFYQDMLTALKGKAPFYDELIENISIDENYCFFRAEEPGDLKEEEILDYAHSAIEELTEESQKEILNNLLSQKGSYQFFDIVPTSWIQCTEGINYLDYVNEKSFLAVVNQKNYNTVCTTLHEAVHGLYFETSPNGKSLIKTPFVEIPSIVMEGSYYHAMQQKGIIKKVHTPYQDQIIGLKNLKNEIVGWEPDYNGEYFEDELGRELLKCQELECGVLSEYFLERAMEDPRNQSKILSTLLMAKVSETGVPDYKDLGITEGEVLQYAKKIGKQNRYF